MDVEKLNDHLKNLEISSRNKEENLQNNDEENRKNEKEKNDLKRKIASLEIIFNWQPYKLGILEKHHLKRLEDKHNEVVEYSEFKFRRIIFQLAIAFENFSNAKHSFDEKNSTLPPALHKLNECEKYLRELHSKNCKDRLFITVYEPLLMHVVLGSKAFMMVEFNQISSAKKIVEEILLVTDMTPEQVAAVYGIKASILLEYGGDYLYSALDYAEKARLLDPSIAEWHFIVGVSLARIRHIQFISNEPTEKEIMALEKAVSISQNDYRFKVHLAESYQETAFHKFIKNRSRRNAEARSLNEKAFNIYREVVVQNIEDSHLLARCALRMCKLPLERHQGRIQLAIETIKKALSISSNNPLVLHYAAIIYDRYTNEVEKAIIFYKNAADLGVFGAAMDLVRMKYSKGSRNAYNLLLDLKKIADDYMEKDQNYQVMANIAAYFLFMKNDVINAWKYVENIVINEPNHPSLRKLKPIVKWEEKPMDFIKVFFDFVKDKINKQKYTHIGEKENLVKIQDTLSKALSSRSQKQSSEN